MTSFLPELKYYNGSEEQFGLSIFIAKTVISDPLNAKYADFITRPFIPVVERSSVRLMANARAMDLSTVFCLSRLPFSKKLDGAR